MIELQNICWTAPDGKDVLRGVSLTIPDHRLTAISGPNGGGKTTLARILMGVEHPASGKILLDGQDITDLDVTERAKLGISFGFQQPVQFKGITVRRMLNLAAGQARTGKSLCRLLEQVGLCPKKYMDRDVDSTLSGGEIKRIEIASVLARNAPIAIFDEPEAGIDLWSFEKLIDVFEELRDEKKRTLVVISHQERILRIADEIIIIADGTVTDHGPSPEMMGKMMHNSCSMEHCCGQTEVRYE